MMNLKEIRKSKGFNQEEASKIVNVPLRTYKRYENDEHLSSSFKYQQILDILNNYQRQKNIKKSKNQNLKIAVAGIGYVGLSIATLLSQNNEVIITDVIKEKIDLVNSKKSPFVDKDIEEYLKSKKLHLKAAFSDLEVYKNQDIVIVATPTDFDLSTKSFNVKNVISVIDMVYQVNKDALVVIKSTIPIGFTDEILTKYPGFAVVFSPEFLREGHSLRDNLYPSRIIVGANKVTKIVKQFASLLEDCALNYIKAIFMSSSDAEAVKLFSNAYLAMRVAYFNELDTYAKSKGLDSKNIIKGMSRDSRIGDYYNNPSFGYGGYCLPKDSEQLQNSFVDIPNNNLIKAIVDSNQTRKNYIADDIIKESIKLSNKNKDDLVVGIYSLAMKSGSDNYRSSASMDIMNLLKEKGIKVIVYDNKYKDSLRDLNEFKKMSDIIVANRITGELCDVKDKIYSRDIYSRD